MFQPYFITVSLLLFFSQCNVYCVGYFCRYLSGFGLCRWWLNNNNNHRQFFRLPRTDEPHKVRTLDVNYQKFDVHLTVDSVIISKVTIPWLRRHSYLPLPFVILVIAWVVYGASWVFTFLMAMMIDAYGSDDNGGGHDTTTTTTSQLPSISSQCCVKTGGRSSCVVRKSRCVNRVFPSEILPQTPDFKTFATARRSSQRAACHQLWQTKAAP